MKITIDATNIKAGGGLTHLKNLIENFPLNDAVVTVVGGKWLNSIKDNKNVRKRIFTKPFKNIFFQEYFKKIKLVNILKEGDIALVPGGTFSNSSIPYISMSQNMLVFEEKERNRFPFSFNRFRYQLLELLQVKSFKNSRGIIYISHYAKNFIENKYPTLKEKPSTVIYHGISDEFRQTPKLQRSISEYSLDNPLKISYISIINFYKHQIKVIDAVKMLRREGIPIELELIGPMYEPMRNEFEKSLKNTEGFIFYKRKVKYEEIADCYKNADLFLFASTCENMPNILLEAMSAGLPILSSNYGPMPEILKGAGIYMDPTDVGSIYLNLKKMLLDENLRTIIADKAYKYSQDFSWEKTAKETFEFIKELA
jgi:glycosyltransferase involved in cell wall biosynthesis